MGQTKSTKVSPFRIFRMKLTLMIRIGETNMDFVRPIKNLYKY